LITLSGNEVGPSVLVLSIWIPIHSSENGALALNSIARSAIVMASVAIWPGDMRLNYSKRCSQDKRLLGAGYKQGSPRNRGLSLN
jgi:hypothetical protein